MYRNLATYSRNNVQYIWESTWDENGKRIEIQTPVQPYLYYEDRTADDTYKSLFGKPLRKMTFNSEYERKDWIKRSPNIPLFEKLPIIRQYLLDKYFGLEQSMEFSQYPFRVFYMDIEVEVDGEFPDQYKADYPINVISIYNTLQNEVIAWCYKSDAEELLTEENQKNIFNDIKENYDNSPKYYIRSFNNEAQMLRDFIKYWTDFYPDIVSGWNSKGYDIPYIVNRIMNQLGQPDVNKLSPAPVRNPIYETYDKKTAIKSYKIQGISLCDYLPLYKKFAGPSKQSFKLDAITKEELSIGKFDYYDIGYDSIEQFMKKDFITFVKYNIIDTVLVRMLDKKLGFITLMRNICNISLCEYEVIYKSMPYILGALTIQARMNNVKFLTDANKDQQAQQEQQDDDYGYTGAFVFPTKAGYYNKGISSFDFNSLYPNIMMTVNISPQTKVGKLLNSNWLQIVNEIRQKGNVESGFKQNIRIRKANGKIVEITVEQLKKLVNQKCTLSGNGVLYLKPALKFGIIPQFLDKMYKERVKVKNQMKANKKKAKAIGDQIQKLQKQLKNFK